MSTAGPTDPDRSSRPLIPIPSGQGQSGFALVLVVWGMGLIALLALSIIEVVHFRALAAANLAAGFRAEALAEAGVGLAVLDRAKVVAAHRAEGERFRADGQAVFCTMPEQGIAALTVEDEAGKVDLNAAQPQLLAAVIAGLGTEPQRAAGLADAIVSFRSRLADARADAAERDAYAKAGLAAGPKRAPFRTTLELGQVLGVTPSLLESLLPLVTVHSGREIPDLAVAPPRLRSILRQDAETTPSYRDVLLVRAEAAVPGGGYYNREAVIRFTGGGRRPYLILEWRRGLRRNADRLEAESRATGATPTPPPC